MANTSDSMYMSGRPGVTGAASGSGCPAPLFSRELENCGYLRSPCKVWIAGNSESAVAAAVGTVSIDVQDPFLGDLVQMHTVDDATGAESDGVELKAITVGTRPQQLNVDATISHSKIFSRDNQLNPLNLDPTGPGKLIKITFENTLAIAQRLYVTVFGRTVSG